MIKREDEGPLIIPRKQNTKQEPIVQKKQKPNHPIIPSYFLKQRKTRVGCKSSTPKEPIKIPCSDGSSSSNNEATPTPSPHPSSPPPVTTKKPLSPINTSKFPVLGSTWRRSWRPQVQQTKEEITHRKFPIALLTRKQQTRCLESKIIQRPHIEPIQRQPKLVTPPQWTWYEYVHTLFAEYVALPPDAIVALDAPSWTRPMYPNLVRMGPQWMPNGTTRPTCLSPVLVEQKQKQKQAITSNDPYDKAHTITLPTIVVNMDLSKDHSTPQALFSKEVHTWAPCTRFIPSHPT